MTCFLLFGLSQIIRMIHSCLNIYMQCLMHWWHAWAACNHIKPSLNSNNALLRETASFGKAVQGKHKQTNNRETVHRCMMRSLLNKQRSALFRESSITITTTVDAALLQIQQCVQRGNLCFRNSTNRRGNLRFRNSTN